MTELDHRTFAIPLFLVGGALLAAGAIGILIDAVAPDMNTNNPAGAAATGALLVFGSLIVTVLLHPGSTVGQSRARTIPVAGLAAILIIASAAAATALGVPAETGLDAPGPANPSGSAALTGFLSTEEFDGEVQGANTGAPLGGLGGPGETATTHELTIPPNAASVRIELEWSGASPGGTETLHARIETTDGETIAEATGSSPLTMDGTGLEGRGHRLIVSLPAGEVSSGQSYTAYASTFTGDIPEDFSVRA